MVSRLGRLGGCALSCNGRHAEGVMERMSNGTDSGKRGEAVIISPVRRTPPASSRCPAPSHRFGRGQPRPDTGRTRRAGHCDGGGTGGSPGPEGAPCEARPGALTATGEWKRNKDRSHGRNRVCQPDPRRFGIPLFAEKPVTSLPAEQALVGGGVFPDYCGGGRWRSIRPVVFWREKITPRRHRA